MEDLVQIEQAVVREVGGSLYVKVPAFLRQKYSLVAGDEVAFLQSKEMQEASDATVVLRIAGHSENGGESASR